MRPILATLFVLVACGPTYQTPVPGPGSYATVPPVLPAASVARADGLALAEFRTAAPRVEAAAQDFCREEYPGRPPRDCDFVIQLVDDPRIGPNAFQTIGPDGRPVIVLTMALLTETGGADEIAFVLSHEAGHHIADHLGKQASQQQLGALILGGIVAAAGEAAGTPVSDQAISDAMNLGAAFGGRVYSQSYELEADTLGAFIAARAGYDPERGALLFARPALASSGGPVLWSTHPASPQRLATVARAGAEIRRQQALGLTPRPGYASAGS